VFHAAHTRVVETEAAGIEKARVSLLQQQRRRRVADGVGGLKAEIVEGGQVGIDRDEAETQLLAERPQRLEASARQRLRLGRGADLDPARPGNVKRE